MDPLLCNIWPSSIVDVCLSLREREGVRKKEKKKKKRRIEIVICQPVTENNNNIYVYIPTTISQ